MADDLMEYLRTHEHKGFRRVPHYSALGDCLTYYFRDERAYAQRVDDLLTVFLSMESRELIGCKIKGVKHILQTAGDFDVTLDDGVVRLGFFFFVGASMAKGEEGKRRYEELRRVAKDVTINREEFQTAGV